MVEHISSLQKVALVRGFGFAESKELASNYPFALIFSEGDPTSTTAPAVFQGEYRYTRFINVNPERKEIQVNDHTIVLHFDYDTGLLSIGDKYILNSIRLLRLSYIPFRGDNIEYIYDDGEGELKIDSKDNKFKLEIQFESDDENNVKYISKELSFGYNDYIQYLGYNSSSSETIGIYNFKVTDTCNEELTLNAKSTYASNIELDSIFEYVKLNPQYLHVYENGINIDNKDTIILEYDQEITIKAILTCDIPNAVFNNFDMRINNMPSYIDVNKVGVYGNEATFKIKCTNIDDNISLKGSFDITIYRDDNPNMSIRHLSKSYRIEVHGEYNDALWYIGNINPEELTINDLMSIEGNPGITVQYSYENNDIENTKYFIISDTYDGIKNPGNNKVGICNNFYKLNDYNQPIYISENNYWIEEYITSENVSYIIINNIKFNIYKFKDDILYNNKFYGKIQ